LSTAYDRTCYHITNGEAAERAAAGEPFVIRLREPDAREELVWEDIVYGRVKGLKKKMTGVYSDIVLLKSDGLPTYHLANVVDDHAMHITHVIRGAEWLISTPRHLELYNAFGWAPPAFAHVGLLLDENKAKLSKRDLRYDLAQMKGYVLPEALNNFLVLLGWSHGEVDEYFSMERLRQKFDLRLNKSNPIVSMEKLDYLQPKHAKARSIAGGEIYEQLLDTVLAKVETSFSEQELRSVGINGKDSLRERVDQVLKVDNNYLSPEKFVASNRYFFASHNPNHGTAALPKKLDGIYRAKESTAWSEEAVREAVLDVLQAPGAEWPSGISQRFPHGLQEAFRRVEDAYIKLGDFEDEKQRAKGPRSIRSLVNFLLRNWLAWGLHGPGTADTMTILGRDVSLDRIRSTKSLKQ
jgi:glutamyl-tRNA synthetase